MFNILTLNQISESGLSLLPNDTFAVSSENNNPDGIILRSFDMHSMELPASLKAIARAGAGVNNIPIDKCSENGVVVFNTPGANANAVKELVIASLFLSARNMVDGINWAQGLKGQTDVAKLVEKGKGQFVGPEVYGKKIGVVGLGAIGVLVANTCKSLGMDVFGFDPFLSIDSAWALSRGVHKAASYDELYAQCDFVTVHVPLNAETKKMLNDEAFAKMKKGVTILNFSRGELVDNDAVKKAIENGIVATYVTDFPTEELIDVKNVIPVPHLGASTPESEDNCAAMAAKELSDYLQYGKINNSVNFPNCELPYSGQTRICFIHKNVPSVISSISTVLADKHMNIDNMINKSKGGNAYTIIDVSQTDNLQEVKDELLAVNGMIAIRIIQ